MCRFALRCTGYDSWGRFKVIHDPLNFAIHGSLSPLSHNQYTKLLLRHSLSLVAKNQEQRKSQSNIRRIKQYEWDSCYGLLLLLFLVFWFYPTWARKMREASVRGTGLLAWGLWKHGCFHKAGHGWPWSVPRQVNQFTVQSCSTLPSDTTFFFSWF